MKINVSFMDWWKGEKSIPSDCMVALAIKRATGALDVSVGYSLIKIEGVVAIPVNDIKSKIRAFDNGEFVLPFSFELTLPAEKENVAEAVLVA